MVMELMTGGELFDRIVGSTTLSRCQIFCPALLSRQINDRVSKHAKLGIMLRLQRLDL